MSSIDGLANDAPLRRENVMRQFKGHSAPHNYIGDAHCNQHHGDDGALDLFISNRILNDFTSNLTQNLTLPVYLRIVPFLK